jgi:sigma-B regulation protein RsbU (phosphoserine phosphatase)
VAGYELFASVTPARQVSGDLYDFLPRGDGRLAFLVGDVSGKGMPAALFMVAVRTLARHLAVESDSPAAVLERLNAALSQDNPSCMFATVAYGLYTPASGEVVLASGGHPPPLLRRPDGHIAPLELKAGRLLGCDAGDLHLSDSRFTLQPGDTLILYTDGFTEARAANSKEMFGLQRLQEALSGARTIMPLETCADAVKTELEQFIKPAELQDDLTMLLLRRAVARV